MSSTLDKLLEVMRQLRDPQRGCPWDREQTLQSLIPYTLEEAYEVADAIEQQDPDALAEELGDLLFQIVFYAQIGREHGWFDFETVARHIVDKLIRRHPHVFGEETVGSVAEQSEAWERHKAQERERKGVAQQQGWLADINRNLPAMSRAFKLQKRAAHVGFDWPDARGVLDKIREELAEVEQALDAGSSAAVQEEVGDLLFACINLARHAGLDPEAALRQTNLKFERRFHRMEQQLQDQGGLAQADLETLEAAWQQAKRELSDK